MIVDRPLQRLLPRIVRRDPIRHHATGFKDDRSILPGIGSFREDRRVGELFKYHEPVRDLGNNDRTTETAGVRDANECILKGRAGSEQREELHRRDLARGRPQSRAGAPLEIFLLIAPYR
jgi:hypothetical protein